MPIGKLSGKISCELGIHPRAIVKLPWIMPFLCQLTCQTADLMALLCGICVCVNFSKSTIPRDMLLHLKDTLSIEHDKF